MQDWNRKDHFAFFKQFEEPFFGITVELDCTNTYEKAKATGASFFLSYLHHTLKAANQTEAFRYRILNDQVWVYDTIHASPTINRPDGSFGFSYMNYEEDFEAFARGAETEIQRVRQTTGLVPAVSGENVIHFSSLPWLSFTSISHARSFSFNDSIPKIAFGKAREINGRRMMSVSVHVHHALMDGFHVAEMLGRLENLLIG